MEEIEKDLKPPIEQHSCGRQSKNIQSNELMLRSMPCKSGNIYKWTNYVSGWKVRYMVVKDGFLSYYESERYSDFQSRATVNLVHCKVSFSSGSPNSFDVSNDRGVVYYFKTIGKNERDEWLSVIDNTKFILKKMMDNDKITENDVISGTFGRGLSTDSIMSSLNNDPRNSSISFPRMSKQTTESPNILLEQIMSKLSARYSQINKINKFITTDINKMIGIVSRTRNSAAKNGNDKLTITDEVNEKVRELLRIRKEFSSLLNKFVGSANEVTINLENDLQETQLFGNSNGGKFAFINTDEEFYSFSEDEPSYINKEAITNKNKTDHISSNKDIASSEKKQFTEHFIDSAVNMGRTYEEQCEIYFKKAFYFLTADLQINTSDDDSKDTWTVAYAKAPTMIYSKKIEIDGVVMDPYRVCSVYKGMSAKEASDIFFDPKLKMEWDQHMETMDLVKWLEQDTCCLLYLTFKTMWPVTRRHSCVLSKLYKFDERDSHECTKHQKKVPDFDNAHLNGKKSGGREVLYVGPAYMVMNFSVENESLNKNINYVKLNALVGFVVRSFVYKSDIADIEGLENVDEYYSVENIENETLRNRVSSDRRYINTMLNYFSEVNPGGWLPPAGVRKVARSEFPKFVASFGEYVLKNVKNKSIAF